MIHFSSISEQYGPQVLFQNTSFQILPGSRIGLWAPTARIDAHLGELALDAR